MNPIKITLFSDYACPFCYVGKGMLKKLSAEYPLEINWVPFELHPETPAQGVLLEEEFPDMDIDEMLNELNKAGADYNIKFNPFDKMPNTTMALQASEFARDHGKLDEFQEEIYRALFTDNKDIGQLDIVLDCAKKVGLNAHQLVEDLKEETYLPRIKAGRKLGDENKVAGIPTFFINEQEKMVGSHTYQAFVDVLEKVQKGEASSGNHTTKACGPGGCEI